MNDINSVLEKIDPKTRARFIKASEKKIEKMALPSLGLTLALQGGFGYGRISMEWGNKSASKSSNLQQALGNAQREGRVCAWVDAENSWDPEWAAKMGVDNDNVIVTESKSINKATKDVGDLIHAGVDIIVIDSISALLPESNFEKDSEELKEVGASKQIGQFARDMGIAISHMNYINEKTAIILISQQRNQFGSMHASLVPMGGLAVKFACSTVVKLWSSEAQDKQIKGEVKNGDLVFEEEIGRPVTWTVDYNKLGPMHRTGSYDFYYQGDNLGVDTVGEVLDYGVRYGVVPKGGAWYTVGDERLQGRPAAIKYLRANPDVTEKIKGDLLGKVR